MSTYNKTLEEIKDSNYRNIENLISIKKSSMVHLGTPYGMPITDMDHFPYTRFFRGSWKSRNPIVIDREAGWRPIESECYEKPTCKYSSPYPNHCFQSPCSTVFPCYPRYFEKHTDRDAYDIQLNNSCIVQYR
jgi:hypothetical protein